MAALHSFEITLRRWLRIANPERVVEWGPGRSTKVIHEECPQAYILSIEHDLRYAQQAQESCGYFADLRHEKIGKRTEYATLAMREAVTAAPFDLAFIDGRRRVECCLAAALSINPNGVIILHDSERAVYKGALAFLQLLEEQEDTAVLRPFAGFDAAKARAEFARSIGVRHG